MLAGHGEIDLSQKPRVEQGTVQGTGRAVDFIARAEHVKVIAKPREHVGGHLETVGDLQTIGFNTPLAQTAELHIEKAHVEACVVDDEFSAFDELKEIVDDVGENRFVGQKGIVQTVYVHRFDRHVTLGVDVLVEKRFGSIAQSAADDFRTTDFHDSIEFRNVHFAYDPEREVINGVSFKIRKGETIALVGPSGGGKSTIADLIPRFYDVTEGEILIDGRNIKDYTLDSLNANIGVVTQETILFNDTIADNLSLGRLDATEEEIEQAAKIANAHEFIMETSDGYQTNIGDRGMKLSGGQRQRLSIARAVLKNPPILILDEATSALDTESEKLVQDALNSLLTGRTSIIIAHRLSTIHDADRIMVVDHGRIVEQGTHSELLALNGIYAKLTAMQQLS